MGQIAPAALRDEAARGARTANDRPARPVQCTRRFPRRRVELSLQGPFHRSCEATSRRAPPATRRTAISRTVSSSATEEPFLANRSGLRHARSRSATSVPSRPGGLTGALHRQPAGRGSRPRRRRPGARLRRRAALPAPRTLPDVRARRRRARQATRQVAAALTTYEERNGRAATASQLLGDGVDLEAQDGPATKARVGRRARRRLRATRGAASGAASGDGAHAQHARQRRRQPPVPAAEQRDERRHEQRADDGRVEQDARPRARWRGS